MSKVSLEARGLKDVLEVVARPRPFTTLTLRTYQKEADEKLAVEKETVEELAILVTEEVFNDMGIHQLAAALSGNEFLHELDFCDNPNITSRGVTYIFDALASHTSITRLHLDWCEIDDRKAQPIGNALLQTPLMQLSLSFNYIGDQGAESIASSLRGNKTLTDLSLWCNRITDLGAGYLGLAIRNNSCLRTLLLGSNNEMTARGAKYLLEGLRENTTITQLGMHGRDLGQAEKIVSDINEICARNKKSTAAASATTTATAATATAATTAAAPASNSRTLLNSRAALATTSGVAGTATSAAASVSGAAAGAATSVARSLEEDDDVNANSFTH